MNLKSTLINKLIALLAMKNKLYKRHTNNPIWLVVVMLLLAFAFTACKKNDPQPEPEPAKPALENLELGLSNSGIGVIGEDFHFDADILAVDKIDKVEVKILPKEGEQTG
jgi:hypothetical protein